ncbi:PIG-L deacetylase family protein [Porphyrobacter sp. ULC335]|jgi:N-acetyl-1-D-myo-inositol-2-amino-2-deoxy-alpha-D-glucopyranoside deacetylase|uniref:PIG-L deacetylase family protein n=1 Tax=Porphyrobacter sp. ULC335 TaxID=2854260 RepID=UPI0022208636|nr:PIG-L family deacetylase [Porphyrobacter sp. ULC335]UYV16478.1 PIG-L family deacetylase [Porphyrobacter sp. ULC335]
MIRITAAIALSALALGTAQAQEPVKPMAVVVAVAHPDDELFMAPAIAALMREGHSVTIVHATPGDAGPGVSGLPTGEILAKTRKVEARCAGRELGGAAVVNLEFGDGKLAEQVRNGSLAKALAGHVAGADLVLTWGPDGGYGHADHRLVSAITTQIVQARPADDRPKLLYVGIPNGSLPPVQDMADWATTDSALLTESISYTPADLAAAKTAALCHATQFDFGTQAGMMPLFDATMWRGKVHFRPAF